MITRFYVSPTPFMIRRMAKSNLRRSQHYEPQCIVSYALNFRDGPLFLTLTHLHRRNIFVDEDWNIQIVIDLEWRVRSQSKCSCRPISSTALDVDGFTDTESVAEIDGLLKEYIAIYKEEETAQNGALYQAPVIQHVWKSGSFWYFQAVKVPKGIYRVLNSNIQPLFNKDHCEESIFDQVFWWYWSANAKGVIQKKLRDKKVYRRQLYKPVGIDNQEKVAEAI